ncbi:MAG: arylsulfatase B [Burkholderiales bacterium]
MGRHARRLRAAIGAIAAWLAAASFAAPLPHIVYILADDLGWKDVGYHGGEAKTPHLDRLAQAGARLERFYTLPNSTPTRAALMTGRYPMRYGLQTLSIQPWSSYGVPSDERLLPQALRDAGYRTAALGEWRLGHARRELWPTRRGFDQFYGSLAAVSDRFRKTDAIGQPDWRRGERQIVEEGYATTLIAREGAAVIARHDPLRPLFLYLAFPAPAAPLQAPKEYLDRYRDVREEQRRAYYAMVSALDDAVGTIVSALEKKGLWENTVLVFHSDNGGAVKNKYPTGDGDVPRKVADNGPFANGRGAMHEGAIRVVALAAAPGRIEPGLVTERIHVTDLYPTLLGLAGARLDPDSQVKPLDGVDVWSAIAEGKPSPRKELLVNVEEFRGAVMVGNWKLIVYAPLPARHELYNIYDDPSEEDNRAEREPQKVRELLARLNEFAWEMAPSLYLADLARARKHDAPAFWGENPVRP